MRKSASRSQPAQRPVERVEVGLKALSVSRIRESAHPRELLLGTDRLHDGQFLAPILIDEAAANRREQVADSPRGLGGEARHAGILEQVGRPVGLVGESHGIAKTPLKQLVEVFGLIRRLRPSPRHSR